MARVDAVFFTFSALVGHLAGLPASPGRGAAGLAVAAAVVFWVFVSYLLLPRLHRILTRLYIRATSSAAPAPATGCSAIR